MDGMRKIPDNVPDRTALEPYLHMPLTVVPNPFGGDYASFGHHNNAMLRRFLDTFGFDYEFASATDYYKSGRFDAVLLRAAEKYDAIMKVMLPTLGEERQATYSPFLPISPKSGRVLYVPMKHVDAKAGTITFDDEDGTETTLPVTGGKVKMQWKPDFGMRWAALGVDFEMFGKDHQTNAGLRPHLRHPRRPRAGAFRLRAVPRRNRPEDLEVEGQWPDHRRMADLCADRKPGALHVPAAPAGEEALFRRHPEGGRRILFLPRGLSAQDWKERLGNPVWHIHDGQPPAIDLPVSFALLLNLVSARTRTIASVLWGFISRHAPGVTPKNPSGTRPAGRLRHPLLRRFREADQRSIARPTMSSAMRWPRCRKLGALPAGRRRGDPERGAQCRAQDRALSGPFQEEPGRRPRRVRRLLPDDLPGADRPGARPALRFVRRALWHRQHACAHRLVATEAGGTLNSYETEASALSIDQN
jgi:hypothetical protein